MRQVEKKSKKKSGFEPVFDLFSGSASLYVEGDDQRTSWLGFACSLIFVITMLIVVIIEVVNFFQHKNSKIQINETVLDPRPIVSLKDYDFAIVYKSTMPEGHPYKGLEHKFLTVKPYYLRLSSEMGPSGYIF